MRGAIEFAGRITAPAQRPSDKNLDPIYPGEKSVTNFGMNVPMKRPGRPAELATAYVILADPESSYISGATIAVTEGGHFCNLGGDKCLKSCHGRRKRTFRNSLRSGKDRLVLRFERSFGNDPSCQPGVRQRRSDSDEIHRRRRGNLPRPSNGRRYRRKQRRLSCWWRMPMPQVRNHWSMASSSIFLLRTEGLVRAR